MYYVYILWSKPEQKSYIGYTANLEERLAEHRGGKVYTTQRYQEIKLIFYEVFLSDKDARRREKYFKTSKGKRTLRIMLRDSLRE